MTYEQQTWLVIAAIYFGLLFSTGIVCTIVYDLVARRKGWWTVSRETMHLDNRCPFVSLVFTGVIMFAFGVLVGHLFFYQVP